MDFSQLKKMDDCDVKPSPETEVEAIVMVKEANYVPNGITIRAKIDEQMFTTETTMERVEELRKDPHVKSVQTSEKLRFPSTKPEVQDTSKGSN